MGEEEEVKKKELFKVFIVSIVYNRHKLVIMRRLLNRLCARHAISPPSQTIIILQLFQAEWSF